jgi:dienelactone hydrolase
VRPVLDLLRTALLVFAAAVLPAAHAQEQVEFDSLDVVGGKPVRLLGHWFAAPMPAASAPALVLLHGCSGPYARSGQLGERMRSYAALLNAQGAHALVLDSLTPRGEKELCTQKVGARQVTQANRRLDALAALAWLTRRSGVDPQRLGLLGWSNGGSTVLAAVNTRHPAVAAAGAKAAFAVAFYPGCEAELKRGFESRTPLLMLVGEADDWTPAAPCHELARVAAGPAKPAIEGYAGAYHGFDSRAPLRLRSDVPNGLNPGQGVHVGGDAAARDASRQRLLQFLAQY